MTSMNPSFDIAGLVVRGATRSDAVGLQRDVGGPTYRIGDSRPEQDEPRHPHGVPAEYDRPSLVELIAGAPRALAVTQAIRYGAVDSPSGAFRQAELEAGARDQIVDLAHRHRDHGLVSSKPGLEPWVFRDRRRSGRRYRNGWNGDGPQEPYPPADAPCDMAWERFERGW